MYRVVAAIDTDEDRAEKITDAIASLPGEPNETEVVLLSVFEEFDVSDDMGSAESEEVFDPESLPSSVTRAKKKLEDAGFDIDVRREHGEPTEVIIEVADELDADAIALSGRKRSPTGKALFGSVTQSVLLSANRPVLVVTTE